MQFFRVVFLLLALASVLCFAMYIGTSDRLWQRRGVLILKWSLIAAGGFFAVLTVERVLQLL